MEVQISWETVIGVTQVGWILVVVGLVAVFLELRTRLLFNGRGLIRRDPVRLPSLFCGSTTETVGLFRCGSGRLAGWLVEGLGRGWVSRSEEFESFESLCRYLTPGRQLSRHALVPWQDRTVMLTDGPREPMSG